MSFRAKTILILIFLSLTPYVITMGILGNIYRKDTEDRLLADMRIQLDIMAGQLDQNLLTLENDLRFIASLDIMNDVLTDDLDQRILNLLLRKKQDLDLKGEFFVTNARNVVVASSDLDALGQSFAGGRFKVLPLRSTFDDQPIGELIVDFSTENLTRLFVGDAYLQYFLLEKPGESPLALEADRFLVVTKALVRQPGWQVMLAQDRNFAFAVLDNLTDTFLIALLLGVILIASLAYWLANYILAPILQLSKTARTITHTQDYSQQVQVQRSDEIGQLSVAFNHMILGMQNMIQRVKEESENRLKLAQEKNRAEMLQVLSSKLAKYLSPQIYESIFSGEKDVTLSSSRKKLTIFFSDIVNFTGTTEKMESEDLTQLLNQYLSEMTRIALKYGATVDKYIGDAIMIFFGDPSSRGVSEDANLCVEMAIAMQSRVTELHDEWQAAGYTKPFRIRIGIHTGFCTVGNFGTEKMP